MVTTTSPSPSPHQEESQDETTGFFPLLVKSVFEPGVNPAVVMAMNVSFFLLLITLFALAVLTSWNMHVLMMLGVTACLWISMVWFVLEISKIQNRPDNMPLMDPDAGVVQAETVPQKCEEPRKDR